MGFLRALHLDTPLPLLVFVTICDVIKADGINFYNIRPPEDTTPFPKSFKCFTCERASDNYNCNRWAEDKWCPQNTQFCMTVHHFTSSDQTRFVSKRCATFEDCHATGCWHHRDTGHHECVACCEGTVCNVEVPTNHTDAVLTRRYANCSEGHVKPRGVLPLLFLVCARTFLQG